MLKLESTHHHMNINTNETSLQENLFCGLSDLVEMYGDPITSRNSIEWELEFYDAESEEYQQATIYQTFENRYDVPDIHTWNIGAHTRAVGQLLREVTEVKLNALAA